MKIILVLVVIFSSCWLRVGASSDLALADYHSMQSPVEIAVPAQYLAAEVRIVCDEDDWDAKLAGIQSARQVLAAAAEKEGFKLRIEQTIAFEISYRKYSFLSSGGGVQEPTSDVLLLAPLSDKSDLVEILKRYRSIVAGLVLPKKVSVSIGGIRLSLDSPENWKKELVKKITEQIDSTAKTISDSCGYDITGLDEPVRVRQKGERELELFLPYRVTYTNHKKA